MPFKDIRATAADIGARKLRRAPGEDSVRLLPTLLAPANGPAARGRTVHRRPATGHVRQGPVAARFPDRGTQDRIYNCTMTAPERNDRSAQSRKIVARD